MVSVVGLADDEARIMDERCALGPRLVGLCATIQAGLALRRIERSVAGGGDDAVVLDVLADCVVLFVVVDPRMSDTRYSRSCCSSDCDELSFCAVEVVGDSSCLATASATIDFSRLVWRLLLPLERLEVRRRRDLPCSSRLSRYSRNSLRCSRVSLRYSSAVWKRRATPVLPIPVLGLESFPPVAAETSVVDSETCAVFPRGRWELRLRATGS